jgi:hypothetical protein
MRTLVLILLLTSLFSQLGNAQNTADIMNHGKLPEKFIKPAKWIYADTIPMVWEDFYCKEVSVKVISLSFALNIIDKDRNFCNLYGALVWCKANYRDAFPELIKRLTDTVNVGLEHYTDLNVLGREEFNNGNSISTGQKPGIVVNEDIFTVAGRASWILNSITGENFASVRHNSTPEKLEVIKQSWIKWIKELKKK